ncbi:MAG: 30S ribosomal protein S30e [Candidatus Lokiarchaeota archaeon]|nr:30S ribosomal protein S30e [Candidatus Lokiarchaeota archaeon]
MPGSHGSLTKAGKVRSQTPKVPSHRPPKEIPRVRNRKNYIKRIQRNRDAGQGRGRR